MFIIIISVIIFSCNSTLNNNYENEQVYSSKNPLKWEKLKCGLYVNSKGEIGFPTRPDYVFKEHNFKGEDKMCPNIFITCLNDLTELNAIIDTNTFKHLGSTFYGDQYTIYNFYAMCDGGFLSVFSRDTSGFKVLNDDFVSHHKSLFHNRSGEINADSETFVVSKHNSHIAKDKNGYFLFNERISSSKLKVELGIELFEIIEKELKN